MTPTGDYYQYLGIPETATPADIKAAFRKLARLYHPDVNPKGEENFKQINEAYQVLSDEQKRLWYDQYRKESRESEVRTEVKGEQTSGGFDFWSFMGWKKPGTGDGAQKQRSGQEAGKRSAADEIAARMAEENYWMQHPEMAKKEVKPKHVGWKGVDANGYYFAIPNKDVYLLAAMVKTRKMSVDGDGPKFQTGIYEVYFSKKDNNYMVSVKEGYLSRLGPATLGVNRYVDLNQLPKGVKPEGYDGYLLALKRVAWGMSEGADVRHMRDDWQTICQYGERTDIRRGFDTRRVGVGEIYHVVAKHEGNIREVRPETGGERTRV